MADIRAFARYFCAMALGAEADPDLKLAFHDLRELKVDVAYPFLLELYHDYAKRLLAVCRLRGGVRLVEAYVFRRAICAIPTNSLNKTFATFTKALKKDRYLESIQAHLLGLPSYRRFPTDDEFRRDLQTRDLYNFRSRSYWLRRLENHGRKERVPVDEYTIEHILPQNENLSPPGSEPSAPSGSGSRNLAAHPRQSDAHRLQLGIQRPPLSPKSATWKAGFKESPLKLNQGLGQLDHWNEEAIKARAEKLGGHGARVSGSLRSCRPTCWRPTSPRPHRRATPSTIIRICSRGPCTTCSRHFARRCLLSTLA